MKIYLDTCCLNRPFNDQTQAQIRRKTEAIQTLLKSCFTGRWLWITSDVLIFEINNTPNQIQRDYMRTQLDLAYQNVSIGAIENTRGQELEALGFKVEILTEKLTPGGLIGFFLQCNPVTGDCSVNRHTWLDKLENGGFRISMRTEKHND